MIKSISKALISTVIVVGASASAHAGACGAEVNQVFQLKAYYDSVPSSNRAEKRNAARAVDEQQKRANECARNETNNSQPDPFITKMRNNYRVN